MSIKRLAPAILSVFILASSASGCATRQSPRSPGPAPAPQGYRVPNQGIRTTPSTQGYTIAPNNIVRNVEKNIMPPRQLASLLSNAEGIINDADSRDWAKVQSRINQIKTSHGQLKPLMQATAVPGHTVGNLGNAISRLEKQAAAKNVYETKLAANKLTQVLPDVASMYKMTVPADMGRISYLTREIALNAEKGDWHAARTNFGSARTMWTGLRSQLSTTYKVDAANLTTAIDNLGKSVTGMNAGMVKNNAKKVSDGLAVIETDFTKQGLSSK